MKKFFVTLLLALSATLTLSPVSLASSGGVALEKANVDIHNKESLQRGAKYYVNYCMGCHSLNFSRYNRVAQDLGLTPEQVKENFIFTRDEDGELNKVGSLMTNAIRPKYAAEWFGNAPPDLSLEGRLRGGDWIYSFLKSFYADPTRPLGVNNTVFANVGMPHVLWELQGMQDLVHYEDEHGHASSELVLTQPGKMSAVDYDLMIHDITNFLVYVGEPAKLVRPSIGVIVLLFMILFTIVAYFLKKEYWKDVH